MLLVCLRVTKNTLYTACHATKHKLLRFPMYTRPASTQSIILPIVSRGTPVYKTKINQELRENNHSEFPIDSLIVCVQF